MLSIIISTYQPHFFSSLETNIAETCGVPYEIIKIDNPGIMGICEAYNKGAKRSKYDYLLFLHEDVLFVNQLWGQKLIEILQKPQCGVVGVAGGDYYSYVPATWWNTDHKFLHFIQADNMGNEHFNDRVGFPKEQSIIPAKALDGVFLASTKKVCQEILFDENVPKYHGYDLVFSLKSAEKYNNFVTDKILLKHFSSGSLSKEWFDSILKVKKIIGRFPNQKIERNIELDNYYKLIFSLKKFGYNKKESLIIAVKYLSFKVHGFKNTIKMICRMRFLLQ